ncbi:MAG: hypothetical protein ACMUHY_01645 [Thermoplasmatota archaeon]
MKRNVWILLLTVVGAAAFAGCLGGDDEEEEGEDVLITINGREYGVGDIFEDFSTITITASNDEEYEGVPLEDLLDDAGVTDLSAHTYSITASDGYMKEVTHLDVEAGILIEADIRTVFPDLPGKYRIKGVVSIEPIDGDTITVNDKLYTWMQPFDLFTETIMYDNESAEYTGVLLSDLINATSLANPQDRNYVITAGDGYQKEVTWDDMLMGLLLDSEDHETFFPHLSKKYWIKDVVEISAV